jgi:uncharacterized membrane protein HdeD (DUF308 family)
MKNKTIINPYQLVGTILLLKGVLSTFKVFAPESYGDIWTKIWVILGMLLIIIPYYWKCQDDS